MCWRAHRQPNPGQEAGALAGGAALLAALLRRRAAPARRLMALAAASARALLAALAAWGAAPAHAGAAAACAEELARVYAAVAAHKVLRAGVAGWEALDSSRVMRLGVGACSGSSWAALSMHEPRSSEARHPGTQGACSEYCQ